MHCLYLVELLGHLLDYLLLLYSPSFDNLGLGLGADVEEVDFGFAPIADFVGVAAVVIGRIRVGPVVVLDSLVAPRVVGSVTRPEVPVTGSRGLPSGVSNYAIVRLGIDHNLRIAEHIGATCFPVLHVVLGLLRANLHDLLGG